MECKNRKIQSVCLGATGHGDTDRLKQTENEVVEKSTGAHGETKYWQYVTC